MCHNSVLFSVARFHARSRQIENLRHIMARFLVSFPATKHIRAHSNRHKPNPVQYPIPKHGGKIGVRSKSFLEP